jgi:Copper type II ascorbate-dependent monooxygenase, C-terminal domain
MAERVCRILAGAAVAGLWAGACAPVADGGARRSQEPTTSTQNGSIIASPGHTLSEVPAVDGGGRPSLGSTPLPCDLDAVLATSCRSCHSANPGLLAPMALTSREDLMAEAVSDRSRSVYELMLTRVHHDAAPMPPAPSRRLSPAELAVIDAMAEDGPALAAADGCVAPTPIIHEGSTLSPADVGTCYPLKAHQQSVAGDLTPHVVEPGEHYSCFYLDMPWPAGAQAVELRAKPGPAAHHIMLFEEASAAPAGKVLAQQPHCVSGNPQLPLAIWVGGQALEQRMPDGVGLQLPASAAGRKLLMEIHYENPGEPIQDDSGYEICVAAAPRPNTASVSLLGTAAYALPPGQAADIKGTCTPNHAGDIHIFRSFPHMHARGRRFEASITRFNGAQEPLLDTAFDSNNQRLYDLDAVLRPGDRMNMTCGFVNDTERTITSGFGTDDEMCNHFVYAWPAGALSPASVGSWAACVL